MSDERVEESYLAALLLLRTGVREESTLKDLDLFDPATSLVRDGYARSTEDGFELSDTGLALVVDVIEHAALVLSDYNGGLRDERKWLDDTYPRRQEDGRDYPRDNAHLRAGQKGYDAYGDPDEEVWD